MKAKGFTLVEMMVSLVVFTILLGGILAFFLYQSRFATDSRAAKIVGEQVNSAMRIIANDVLHAGVGITDPLSQNVRTFPELGLYVDVVDGSQQLYVNWVGFLDFDAIPLWGEPVNSVFRTQGYMDLRTPVSSYEIKFVPDSVKASRDIGGLIVRSGGSVSGEQCQVSEMEKNNGRQTLSFTITEKDSEEPKAIEGQAAPAIVYKLVKGNDGSGKDCQLYRNALPILGGTVTGHSFRVTNFSVQCRFSDASTKNEEWSPKGATLEGFNMKNLKLVRVTIDYTWKAPHLGRRTSSSTIDVAPRGLVKIGG